MKKIISYIRYSFNKIMDIVFKRLYKTIPFVLLIAFLVTFADFSVFIKIKSQNVDIYDFQGEVVDLSDIESEYELIDSNWNEAQMLREFEYHDRGYALTSIFGNPFGLTDRFKKVDFEDEQNLKTYAYRSIGNMMFW